MVKQSRKEEKEHFLGLDMSNWMHIAGLVLAVVLVGVLVYMLVLRKPSMASSAKFLSFSDTSVGPMLLTNTPPM